MQKTTAEKHQNVLLPNRIELQDLIY